MPFPRGRAKRGGGGEGRDPPVSIRCRERGASGVGRLPRPQDRESAGSTKVETYATFALLPRSDFPRRRPRQNSEGVVIPWPLPCIWSIAPSVTKYASTARPQGRFAI